MLEDQRRVINQYESKIRNLESAQGRSPEEIPNSELFDKQNEILMNLAAKLNERD